MLPLSPPTQFTWWHMILYDRYVSVQGPNACDDTVFITSGWLGLLLLSRQLRGAPCDLPRSLAGLALSLISHFACSCIHNTGELCMLSAASRWAPKSCATIGLLLIKNCVQLCHGKLDSANSTWILRVTAVRLVLSTVENSLLDKECHWPILYSRVQNVMWL